MFARGRRSRRLPCTLISRFGFCGVHDDADEVRVKKIPHRVLNPLPSKRILSPDHPSSSTSDSLRTPALLACLHFPEALRLPFPNSLGYVNHTASTRLLYHWHGHGLQYFSGKFFSCTVTSESFPPLLPLSFRSPTLVPLKIPQNPVSLVLVF